MSKPLPSAIEFLLEIPLYRTYKIFNQESDLEKNVKKIEDIIFYTGTIDTYCTVCKNVSTFKSQVGPTFAYKNYLDAKKHAGLLKNDTDRNLQLLKFLNEKKYFKLNFQCTRECSHEIDFYFQVGPNRIIKVGQFPSQYDLNKSGLKKYNKILTNIQLEEFNKAISLASSGIGIGAFVYLRRIFENLVEEAHLEAVKDPNFDDKKYLDSTMDNKIELLKNHLPSFLVENTKIYGILSKGIHQLSEEECNDIFEILKVSIELILDEKIKADELKKKAAAAKKSLQLILQKKS